MSTILLLMALLSAGHSVPSEVCSRKLDLIFNIDGSSSICGSESCPEWRHILQFVKNIVASFNIGPDNTRVALFTDSNGGKLEWNFDQYPDENSLLSAIDNVLRSGAELDTMCSIKDILTRIIATSKSQRPDATVVVISITDGAPELDPVPTIAASTALQALGMNMFVVCVTDRCPADFARSASSPPKQIDVNYFLVNDYCSIDNVKEKLVKQICSFKKPGVLCATT